MAATTSGRCDGSTHKRRLHVAELEVLSHQVGQWLTTKHEGAQRLSNRPTNSLIHRLIQQTITQHRSIDTQSIHARESLQSEGQWVHLHRRLTDQRQPQIATLCGHPPREVQPRPRMADQASRALNRWSQQTSHEKGPAVAGPGTGLLGQAMKETSDWTTRQKRGEDEGHGVDVLRVCDADG